MGMINWPLLDLQPLLSICKSLITKAEQTGGCQIKQLNVHIPIFKHQKEVSDFPFYPQVWKKTSLKMLKEEIVNYVTFTCQLLPKGNVFLLCDRTTAILK